MGDAARTRAELGKEDGIGEEGAPPSAFGVGWVVAIIAAYSAAEHGARTV